MTDLLTSNTTALIGIATLRSLGSLSRMVVTEAPTAISPRTFSFELSVQGQIDYTVGPTESVDKAAAMEFSGDSSQGVLTRASYVAPSQVALKFKDGRSFTVSLSALSINAQSAQLNTIRTSSSGRSLQFEVYSGDTYDIDSCVVRGRIDPAFAAQLRQAIASLQMLEAIEAIGAPKRTNSRRKSSASRRDSHMRRARSA